MFKVMPQRNTERLKKKYGGNIQNFLTLDKASPSTYDLV